MSKFILQITIFTALVLSGSAAWAQKLCNLGIEIIPNPAILNYGDTSHISIKISNDGPASMTPADTIYYGQVGSSTIFFLVPSGNIQSGSSETFTNALYYHHGIDTLTADRALNFCFKIYSQINITNGSNPVAVTYIDPESSNDTSCKSIILLEKSATGLVQPGGMAKELLIVYPNPTADKVFFELNLARAEKVQASVKDITGREVMRYDFGKIQGTNKVRLSLDLSPLQAGTYIVELNSETRRAVGKVTKK